MSLFDPSLVDTFTKAKQSIIYTKNGQPFEPLGAIPAAMCPKFSTYMMDLIADESVDFIFVRKEGVLCGILLAELDVCGKHAPFWTIRLLCANYTDSRATGVASLLTGCYCWHLKNLGQPIGLLELGGGFDNIRAYCLYAKYGFLPAPHFRCKNMTNVILSTDIRALSFIDILKGIPVDDPMCIPGPKQREYIRDRTESYRVKAGVSVKSNT